MRRATGSTGSARISLAVTLILIVTIGRDFWTLARQDRLSTSENRRIHRFHHILDEEYQASLATPAIPPPDPAPGTTGSVQPAARGRRRIRTLLAAVATAAGIAAIVRAFCRSRGP